jgi:hypothetical protein
MRNIVPSTVAISYCASVGEKTLIIIKMHGMYVKIVNIVYKIIVVDYDIYSQYRIKPVGEL